MNAAQATSIATEGLFQHTISSALFLRPIYHQFRIFSDKNTKFHQGNFESTSTFSRYLLRGKLITPQKTMQSYMLVVLRSMSDKQPSVKKNLFCPWEVAPGGRVGLFTVCLDLRSNAPSVKTYWVLVMSSTEPITCYIIVMTYQRHFLSFQDTDVPVSLGVDIHDIPG